VENTLSALQAVARCRGLGKGKFPAKVPSRRKGLKLGGVALTKINHRGDSRLPGAQGWQSTHRRCLAKEKKELKRGCQKGKTVAGKPLGAYQPTLIHLFETRTSGNKGAFRTENEAV